MDEPWNTRINRKFARIVAGSQEKEYYTPYDALLHEVFPINEGYFVSPQVYPLKDRKSVDFGVEYEIGFENPGDDNAVDTPVMLLEIKKSTHIIDDSTRREADSQVRERFTAMRGSLKVPTLIVISALGTRCCIYRYTWATGVVVPPMIIPQNPRYSEDLAPQEWWNIDIATLDGRLQLNRVFDEVKAMARALN
ncbi:hypothetical protein MVEG_12438 [Podila verticillata NRRL 6337]|uniref:Uncharacterized protein n=1 Tax=Podila verticillata NRRL 6337 TaxID=1069443 RepID=A0A086TIE5_9FUNG|nr:hypothetical protein MVEG_12438 [Podila verticillata NRRL 6337]